MRAAGRRTDELHSISAKATVTSPFPYTSVVESDTATSSKDATKRRDGRRDSKDMSYVFRFSGP